MISMQRQKSGFAPLFLIFLICTQQRAWQGYGQVNRTVVDAVMGYINTNVSQYTSTSNYDTFNTAFSSELNRRWDPAWNVFTITTDSPYDSVVYGYAFNNQWMWYNDYRVNGVVLAFIVWKDYNCQGWKTVGKNGVASALTNLGQINFSMTGMSYTRENMWSAAKQWAEEQQNRMGGPTVGAYSVVLTQDTNADIYGRICTVGNNYYYTKRDSQSKLPFRTLEGGSWGNILMFQTR